MTFILFQRAILFFLACLLGSLMSLPVLVSGETNVSQAPLTSLENYLSRGLSANPEIEAFKQRYEAAMQRIPQASSLPDPVLQVTHWVESVQTRTGPQETVFMLSQKIPWFGTFRSRESVASAEAEALWFAFQNQQLALARKISLAFYEYGYTKEAVRLTQENRHLLQKLEPIVEEKVRGGAELNALLRLKVEIGKMDDRLQVLKRKRMTQSANLRGLLALEGTGPLPWPEWDTPPEQILPDRSAMEAGLRSSNPQLQMLERRIASAEARREIARLESYPDFTLGFNYIQTGDPVVNPGTPDAGQDPYGFTVAVNLPIWSGKYNASKAEALANKRSSESDYDHQYNILRAELSSSLETLRDAHRQLQLYGNELLKLARQAVENSRTSYESGRTGILDVIDSERSLLELELLYWRAAADAWQQRIIIQTLANKPILGTFNQQQENE